MTIATNMINFAKNNDTDVATTLEQGKVPTSFQKNYTAVDGLRILKAIEEELETGSNDAISPGTLLTCYTLIKGIEAFEDRFNKAITLWREIEYQDIRHSLTMEEIS